MEEFDQRPDDERTPNAPVKGKPSFLDGAPLLDKNELSEDTPSLATKIRMAVQFQKDRPEIINYLLRQRHEIEESFQARLAENAETLKLFGYEPEPVRRRRRKVVAEQPVTTRKSQGVRVSDVPTAVQAATADAPKTEAPKRRGRPAGSKNKPKTN